MSARTAQANKAIRLAWERERDLVLQGKGTRNWTEQQQRDIIEKGKAYDDNGRAFDGQHMKSVAEYPEYQGDPGNIQFLTKDEHLAAHKGSWQNSTNWYYNLETGEYVDFGENKYSPCPVIKLSNPISVSNSGECESNGQNVAPQDNGWGANKTYGGNGFLDKFDRFMNSPKGIALRIGINVASAVTGALSSASSKQLDDYSNPDVPINNATDHSTDAAKEVMSERDYPENRLPPQPHTVSGHDRHLKDGRIIHIEPYTRGTPRDE